MDIQTELFHLKPQIENETPLQLNWSASRVVSWITFIVASMLLLFVIRLLVKTPETNIIIGAIISLLLFLWTTYQFVFTATAVLEGSTLKLKRLFTPEVAVHVSQIETVRGFSTKQTFYTFVTYKNSAGDSTKALIHNSRSPIFGEEVPAKFIIQFAQILFAKQ
jgi:hypothetical protein